MAKATRILHARKSNMYFENNLFRRKLLMRLEFHNKTLFRVEARPVHGKWWWFQGASERVQRPWVSRSNPISKRNSSGKECSSGRSCQKVFLKSKIGLYLYFSEDELTEDEVGIINELANHEQSSNIASGKGSKFKNWHFIVTTVSKFTKLQPW